MSTGPRTLGTLLRTLIEQLDGAVEQAYQSAGLDYRPRYTPIIRTLMAQGPVSIRAIAQQAKVSHSAVSQTVSQMVNAGLVELQPGADARERIVALTPRARTMLPALERQWAATNAAAEQLDKELSAPLSRVLAEALQALEREPFDARLEKAAAKLKPPPRKGKSRE
ncbi:winged helix-turn-helix transcriptional regulator [Pyxidicoccus parkwayensis]|uniref:Winged helix-turn-helix transcriptional regulator n=1 Tax=Pyxidicoccus parkwayensis TaxID=2813578 RepID=A0ABX7P035_9BACT|nr:MarR family transcriptional regulator [Pyxidicoccus parkwaysis]QSQ21683.1 winged helix-turn-helix transcriptional regulator [Pyxidicoccus parkwaysis]